MPGAVCQGLAGEIRRKLTTILLPFQVVRASATWHQLSIMTPCTRLMMGGFPALAGAVCHTMPTSGPRVWASTVPGRFHSQRVMQVSRPPSRGAGDLAAGHRWSIESLVNLESYPIHELHSAMAQKVIADCQRQMKAEGYCLLRGFLQPTAVIAARKEVQGREDACFVHSRRVNIWGENPQQHGNLHATALRRLSAPDMYGAIGTFSPTPAPCLR